MKGERPQEQCEQEEAERDHHGGERKVLAARGKAREHTAPGRPDTSLIWRICTLEKRDDGGASKGGDAQVGAGQCAQLDHARSHEENRRSDELTRRACPEPTRNDGGGQCRGERHPPVDQLSGPASGAGESVGVQQPHVRGEERVGMVRERHDGAVVQPLVWEAERVVPLIVKRRHRGGSSEAETCSQAQQQRPEECLRWQGRESSIVSASVYPQSPDTAPDRQSTHQSQGIEKMEDCEQSGGGCQDTCTGDTDENDALEVVLIVAQPTPDPEGAGTPTGHREHRDPQEPDEEGNGRIERGVPAVGGEHDSSRDADRRENDPPEDDTATVSSGHWSDGSVSTPPARGQRTLPPSAPRRAFARTADVNGFMSRSGCWPFATAGTG